MFVQLGILLCCLRWFRFLLLVEARPARRIAEKLRTICDETLYGLSASNSSVGHDVSWQLKAGVCLNTPPPPPAHSRGTLNMRVCRSS